MSEMITTHISEQNTSLVIFIHGFTGDALDTWTYKSGEYSLFFPDVLRDATESKFDIVSFEYHTTTLEWLDTLKNSFEFAKSKVTGTTDTSKGNISIDELANTLLTELRFGKKDYEEIFIVAHSMGGLIAKSLLLKSSRHDTPVVEKIKSIVFLATPHNGTAIANYADLISSNIQIENLSALSEFITKSNVQWVERKSSCNVYCVYGTNDKVVNKNAATLIDQSLDLIATDYNHNSICKPESQSSINVSIVSKLIRSNSAMFSDPLLQSPNNEVSNQLQNIEKLVPAKDEFIHKKTEIKGEAFKGERCVGSQFIERSLTHVIHSGNAKTLFEPIDGEPLNLHEELLNLMKEKQTGRFYFFCSVAGSGKTILANHLYNYIEEALVRNGFSSKLIIVELSSLEKDFILGEIDWSDLKRVVESTSNKLAQGNYFAVLDGFEPNHEISDLFLSMLEKNLHKNTFLLFARTYKGVFHRITDSLDEASYLAKGFGIKPDRSFKVGYPKREIDSENFEGFLDLTQSIINAPREKLSEAVKLLVNWFFENRNNIRLLSLLVKYQQDDTPNYGPAPFLRNYFRKYLRRFNKEYEESNEVFAQASEFCYDMVVRKKSNSPNSPYDHLLKRASTQSFEMIGYLASNYICKKIWSMDGFAKQSFDYEVSLQVMDNVYPYLLNKYSKNILVQEYDEDLFFKKIEHIYNDSGVRLQAFLCYLLGRLKNKRVKRKAIHFLSEKRRKFGNIEDFFNDKEKRNVEKIVLHRTIYISLIYLGDPIDKDYIKQIASSPVLDKVNRGFHLSYYGDNNYIQDKDMVSLDIELKPFHNTYRQIAAKIFGSGESTANDSMLNLAVFTLFSLSYARLQARNLSETISKEEIKSIASIALGIDGIHQFNKLYIKTFLVYLDSEFPPITQSLVSMYDLKRKRRAGWNIDDIDSDGKKVFRDVSRAESVSEHSDFVVRLALIYLPSTKKVELLIKQGLLDRDDYAEYDKFSIIKMLSVHDLGEYLDGDIVRFKRTEKHNVREKMAVKRLSLITSCFNSDLLADPYDTIYSPWEKFEKTDGDINTDIARELDSIECLIQLHLYNSEKHNNIEDNSTFSSNLRNKINTRLGNEILQVVVEPLVIKSLAKDF